MFFGYVTEKRLDKRQEKAGRMWWTTDSGGFSKENGFQNQKINRKLQCVFVWYKAIVPLHPVTLLPHTSTFIEKTGVFFSRFEHCSVT